MTGFLRGRGPKPLRDELGAERRRRDSETVDCQICRAPAGQVCTDRPGRPVPGTGYHPDRHRRFVQGW